MFQLSETQVETLAALRSAGLSGLPVSKYATTDKSVNALCVRALEARKLVTKHLQHGGEYLAVITAAGREELTLWEAKAFVP